MEQINPDELAEFAKKNHKAFAVYEIWQIRKFFELFKQTTIVVDDGEKVQGFAVYVDRPECLYFLAIAGIDDFRVNLKNLLRGRHRLPKKTIMWNDNRMELHRWVK